jgi:hypothetical protein
VLALVANYSGGGLSAFFAFVKADVANYGGSGSFAWLAFIFFFFW